MLSLSEGTRKHVFSTTENDATLGGAMTKSGKAFHARVAATGKEQSPRVARRVTRTTSVDDCYSDFSCTASLGLGLWSWSVLGCG